MRVFQRPAVFDSDADAMTNEDFRDLAGVTLGSRAMTFETWPPPQVPDDDETDERRLARERLEGRRGGNAGAREVPPLDKWPFYKVALAEFEVLTASDCELKDFKRIQGDIKKSFALARRWQDFNNGRSLGFLEKGAAKLSAAIVTVPVLMRQLQGLGAFYKWAEQQQAGCSAFEEFLRSSGADEDTANELRAVVCGPNGIGVRHERHAGNVVHVDSIIGSTRGAAMAVWYVDVENRILRVDFCTGHDCMTKGPYAEEVLLRLIAGEAVALGAEKLLCRPKFTEDGQIFVPSFFDRLGLAPVAPEEWEGYGKVTGEEEVSPLSREVSLVMEGDALMAAADAIPEYVPGLRTWLRIQGLEEHLEAVNAWCEEMGAVTLPEVVESRHDLVESLGDALSGREKEIMLARTY